MKDLLNRSNKILPFVFIAGMFALCVILLVIIFPKQPRFEYEFTINSPWLHDDLIADFDFPVYITDEEIKEKTDSVINHFIPYYSLDTSINNLVITHFKEKLAKIKEEIVESSILQGVVVQNRNKRELEILEKRIIDQIYKCYDQGVISINKLGKNDKFNLIFNEIVQAKNLNEFYSQAQVIEKINNIIVDSQIYKRDSAQVVDAFKNIMSEYFIIPNINYNYELNDKILSDEINSISKTLGVVQAGELIILKGNIIDKNTYTKLLSLKKVYESGESAVNLFNITIGIIILLILLFTCIVLYLNYYFREQLYSYKAVSYIVLQIVILMIIAFITVNYTNLNLNIIPFTLIAIFIVTFYSFHIAFFVYLAAILIVGFTLTGNFEFLFIQIIAGLMALFSIRQIHKRRQIFVTVLIVFATYALLHSGFVLVRLGSFSTIEPLDLAFYGISSFLLLLYLPIIYLYEKIFGFVSDFSLMELSDTNNPALRQLAEKAPGTFQHTLQVANLTESVVRELGGNALLARTGALYHDIGKAVEPQFFVENQSTGNLHDKLSYEESAEKIIEHVHNGIKLAKKFNLPKQVADFITMHHGTGMTKYFYNSWKNENPGKDPEIEKFSYPGPKPQNLETAIMMMADSIEAASRTLKTYSEESIANLVDSIVNSQLEDEQFSEVDITLKQITIAKKVFIDKIKNIYHTRIEYPELK